MEDYQKLKAELAEKTALLKNIKEAWDKTLEPIKSKCTCSSFALQYDGSCQCNKDGTTIKIARRNKVHQLIMSIE
jgi:hypothetical protein